MCSRSFRRKRLFPWRDGQWRLRSARRTRFPGSCPCSKGRLGTAERAAEIIATERGAAVAAISADLVRTIDFAQRERIAVLEYLTLERQTAIDDLRKTITAEREAVVSDTEQVAVRLVDRAMDRVERLVLKVIVVLLVAIFAALLMIRLLFRRPTHAASAAI